jgi:hypothetical protein
VRTNIEGKPVDFGFAVTDGAFRVQKVKKALRLTPLPQVPPFDVTLRLSAFGLTGAEVTSVVAIDSKGKERKTDFRQRGDELRFSHDGEAFCYDVRL